MENSTETNWTTYQYVQRIFYFTQIAFFALCLMGNSLTMIAVAKFENLHKKPTNILIFSLAIADGFQGLSFCILDPTCNEFSFNDRKITTNTLLCIKIIDPNVKKFDVRQPPAYNKKNLYLSVPPQGNNQGCFCENKKAFQLNANHSHYQQAQGSGVRVY